VTRRRSRDGLGEAPAEVIVSVGLTVQQYLGPVVVEFRNLRILVPSDVA